MIKNATLQQMRLFSAVARHLNYTRAAEEVYLTQPAVSIQVKRLENHVGEPLFETVGKQLYLTQAGEILYHGCQDILDRISQLEQQFQLLAGDISGLLKISAVTTAKYFLPAYLGEFLHTYPQVIPQLKVTNRASVLERMGENRDDLYIVGLLPNERKNLITHPFRKDQLVVFAHPSHPLAKEKNIPMAQLRHERILARELGSGIRESMEQHFLQHEIEVTPYMELGSGEAIKQGVMADIGIGILSDISLWLELEVGKLVVLDVEEMPITRHWHVIYPEGKYLSPVALQFLKLLME